MKTYVVVDGEGKYAGYSNYCIAFAEKMGLQVISVNEAIIEVPKEAGLIISAGGMGIEIVDQLLPLLSDPKDYNFALMSDHMVDAKMLNAFGGLVIVTPSFCVQEFKSLCPSAVTIAADLAPAPSQQKMMGLVEDFEAKNNEAASIIASAEEFGFIGGRVATIDGWKEISTGVFEQIAENLMEIADGKNLSLVLHGLRGVTKSNGETYLEPSEALCLIIKLMLHEDQTISVLTAIEVDGKREPVLKILSREGESIIFVDNTGASGYYFAMAQAVKKGVNLHFSAEQMNFTKEALVQGADLKKILPFADEFGWSLTVEANLFTHKSVREAAEEGLPVSTLDEALVNYLS